MFYFRKKHKTPHEVDFESSKSPAKSESWNRPNLQCCAAFPTWQHCRKSSAWWMCEINLASRLSHAWVHFVTALGSLLTDHRMSRRPFVPSTSISSQFASKLLTILQLIGVLPAWIDDHPSIDLKLCKVAPLSWLPIHSIAQRIFEHVPQCRKTTLHFAREVLHIPVIFRCSSRSAWFTHLLLLFDKCFIRFEFTLSTSQVYMVTKRCGFVNIHFFHQFLQHGSHILLLPSHFFLSSTFSDRNNPCFRWTNIHSQFGTFSHQSFFELSFPYQSSWWVTMGILNNLGASSNFTWV